MIAFLKNDKGLYKIYRQDDDWQLIGPDIERWHSVWRADVKGSLHRIMEIVAKPDEWVIV